MTAMPKRIAPHALAFVLLAGCGGGGSSHHGPGNPVANDGRVSIAFAWPARNGRFIPLSANSVVVSLLQNGVPKGQALAVRPGAGASNARADFSGLAYGAYDVSMKAYPTADGTGVAQAEGLARIAVGEGAPATASVSLGTTVASLTILPVSLDKLQGASVSVAAKDKDGNTVLLAIGDDSEAVTWSLDPPAGGVAVGTLTASTGPTVGLTATHSGTTTIRASVNLGGATPVTATGSVTVNAIADGTATVTVQ